MPRPKKNTPEPEPTEQVEEIVEPDEVPDSLIQTIGLRDVQHTRHARVQARHPQTGQLLFGDYGPLMTTEVVTEVKPEVQPNLTLAEAKLLGEQNWEPWPGGGYKTIIKGRRLLISAEVYRQLCQG